MNSNNEVLINISDLVIEFRNKGKKFQAVKGANFDIYKGEIFGLVGESGSGKTTIGRAVAGVQAIADGSIYLNNQLIAGKPTSLFLLNKDINRKIKSIDTKYSINCNYINRIIFDLKKTFETFKSNPKLLDKTNWKKNFSFSYISLVHKLTKENLKFVNEIIKDFKRINKFILNISNYIKEIPLELEKAILEKNLDTLDIVIRLKDKMSLDFYDLDSIKNKIRTMIKSVESKSLVENDSSKTFNEEFENYSELMLFIFSKIDLIQENNDRIKRRIKIARKLEIQNFDLSSPGNQRKEILKKYYDMVYVSKHNFVKVYNRIKLEPNFSAPNDLQNFIDQLTKKESVKNQPIFNLVDDYVTDKNYRDLYYTWINYEFPLTEREENSILKLINWLKLPSIDDIVNDSYLFDKTSSLQKRNNRRDVQMIFQDPGSSLNDRMAVEEVIAEGLENFPELYKTLEVKAEYVEQFNSLNPNNKISIDQIEKASDVKKYLILKLIKSVGLLPEHLSRYPHEFSGGQKQRIGISRSLALKPKIIIADEPISALDVSIRAQVLNLFQEFRKEFDLTYLFITHDLSVVKFIADRIAVIYHGDIVELADAEELFNNPLHPYTKSLLSAIPQPDPDYKFDENLIVYDPKAEHYDYIFDVPEFVEVCKNHFVLANKREIEAMNLQNKK